MKEIKADNLIGIQEHADRVEITVPGDNPPLFLPVTFVLVALFAGVASNGQAWGLIIAIALLAMCGLRFVFFKKHKNITMTVEKIALNSKSFARGQVSSFQLDGAGSVHNRVTITYGIKTCLLDDQMRLPRAKALHTYLTTGAAHEDRSRIAAAGMDPSPTTRSWHSDFLIIRHTQKPFGDAPRGFSAS